MNEYEEAIKTLNRAARQVGAAALAAQSLEDKLKFVKAERALRDCGRRARLQYFEVQEAAEMAKAAGNE